MDNNEEKDIFIKYKLSKIDADIPENIDNLFNNLLNEKGDKEDKMENRKVKKISFFRKYSMVAAVAMICIVFFSGANIYANTQGYGNVFFMIKYLISDSQEEITKKEEIIEDQDIVISYMNIDLLEELHIQINKLEVKNNTAQLKFRILADSTELEESLNLSFKVYDNDSKKELYFDNKIIENEIYSLILDNYTDDINNIKFEIYNHDKILSNIVINLETKELQVLQGYELDKLSEIELKKYLEVFAFLNYNYIFAKKDINDVEIYDNESLLISAIQYSYLLNEANEIEEDVMFASNSISNEEKYLLVNKEKIDEILQNVFDKNMNDSFNIGVDFDTIEYNNKLYYYITCDYIFWPNALCVEVKNASFLNGIYKITYSYCFPYGDDFEGKTMDTLPVFESTISFKYNKDSDYKYSIIDFERPELLLRGNRYINLYLDSEIEKTNLYDET